MIELPNVTIIAVDTITAEDSLRAIKYSCREINFGAKKLITSQDIKSNEVEIIQCEPINYEQFSHFCVYRLHEYVDTEFALLIHPDGYVVNPDMWTDEFLEYDYIGAIWPLPHDDFSFRDEEGTLYRVGNGGFTLRSKKLLSLAKELNLEWKAYHGFYNEDGFYCVHHRKLYEKHGFKFAPMEVAAKFSHECYVPENEGIIPFGFHGKNNFYYHVTKKSLLQLS
jgi:hypothetical protein